MTAAGTDPAGPTAGGGVVTGVVLAGGASRRFGTPKATARLGGRTLIEYPLAAMREAGLPVLIVAKAGSELGPAAADVNVLHEPDTPRHPLQGIVAALEHTGAPIVTCACDMPFAGAALFAWLASLNDDLAIAESGGRPQPMLGRYTPAVLPALREALAAEQPMHTAVSAAGGRMLGRDLLSKFGDDALLTLDIDTPEQLAAAERIAAARAG